ncbi:hypothetical protein F5878DRAFT_62079 [Lentinula raphanica]|uniref:Uncharacterized protein n=1 Tax=Lentinula raphanica TaxID=153919 RepID=A0AA38NVZ2_9AGAR|nr:hypothetical protein F5878DRAFT_62079 [Lentinula raphanica]
MRAFFVALLLASALGSMAAPLPVTGQNATEQHLERRARNLNDPPIGIFAQFLLVDGKEYPFICLGTQQILDFKAAKDSVITNIKPSKSEPGLDTSRRWDDIPSRTNVHNGSNKRLGTLIVHDPVMKMLLLGNKLKNAEKHVIHAPLSGPKHETPPTALTRLELADAIVRRIRNLDHFYDQQLENDLALRVMAEIIREGYLDQQRNPPKDRVSSTKKREGQKRDSEAGKEGNKKQRTRRGEPIPRFTFTEEIDPKTEEKVWDELYPALSADENGVDVHSTFSNPPSFHYIDYVL